MEKDPPKFRNRLSDVISMHVYSPDCRCTRCNSVRKGVEKTLYTLQGNVVKLNNLTKVIQVDFKARKIVR